MSFLIFVVVVVLVIRKCYCILDLHLSCGQSERHLAYGPEEAQEGADDTAWYGPGLQTILKCKSGLIRKRGEELRPLLQALEADEDDPALRRLQKYYWPELIDGVERFNAAISPKAKVTVRDETLKIADICIQVIYRLLESEDADLVQAAKVSSAVVTKISSMKGDIPTTSPQKGSILQTRRDPDVCSEQQQELDENHGVVSQQ